MVNSLQIIDIKASSHYEIGVHYGREAEEKIRAGLADYRLLFSEISNLSWEDLKKRAMAWVPLLKKEWPDLLEEVRGIADGSGTGLDDIMFLNCRYEITKFPRPNECTSFAILPEASRGGKTFIGQNWDYRAGIIDNITVLNLETPDGTRIIGLAEAGQVIRNGFNSRGIGLCANNLQSVYDSPEPGGMPVTFLRRKALSCGSFDGVKTLLADTPRNVSCNFITASADGVSLDFEAHPRGTDLLEPLNGILTHANHFVKNPGRNAIDTSPRGDRLRELLEKRSGDIDVSWIKQCLADHENYPKAICRHPSDVSLPLRRRSITVASVIYDLTDGEAHICSGPPCEGAFIRKKI